MLNRDVLAPEFGVIWQLFPMLWLQNLETFIYYQGGDVVFIAFVLFEIIVRSH